MYARIVMVALLLCVALALPVAANVGACQAIGVYFQGGTDNLEIVNLVGYPYPLDFQLYKNDGTLLNPTPESVTLGASQRLRMTATDLYALFGLKSPPGFNASRVGIYIPGAASSGP